MAIDTANNDNSEITKKNTLNQELDHHADAEMEKDTQETTMTFDYLPRNMFQNIPSDVIFIAQIMHGYSIRLLVDYLRATCLDGNFLFYSDRITYKQRNANKSVLNDVYIDTRKIMYYFNDEYEEPVKVGLHLPSLAHKSLKSVVKSDGFRFYTRSSQQEDLTCNVITNNPQDNNETFVDIINVEMEHYPLPPFSSLMPPNCSVKVAVFCKYCSLMTTAKCITVSIKAYPHGILLEGKDAYNKVVKRQPVGSLVNADIQQPITEVILPIPVIKAMSKMNNISAMASSSLIHFYFLSDCPIKMQMDISNFGWIASYLQTPVPLQP